MDRISYFCVSVISDKNRASEALKKCRQCQCERKARRNLPAIPWPVLLTGSKGAEVATLATRIRTAPLLLTLVVRVAVARLFVVGTVSNRQDGVYWKPGRHSVVSGHIFRSSRLNRDACIRGLSIALVSILFVISWPAHSEQVAANEAVTVKDLASNKLSVKSSTDTPQIERAAYTHKLLGNLIINRLDEASGLALSTRSQDLAWSHNDSGHGPYIFAFTLKGEARGRFYLENAPSSDWEDIDAFRWQNQSWLMIADTGDNRSIKPYYTLYLVAEPETLDTRSSKLRTVRDVQRIRITFPTGPADTEALAVDETEERVYLITKRKRPAEVFSVPLEVFNDSEVTHEARFETYLYSLPSPTLQELLHNPKFGLAFAQPNALDIAPDRSFAIVHTYGASYRFDRESQQTWAQAFASAPKQINVPPMKQSEAVAIGWDNRSLYYTSEGKHPPLYRLEPASTTPPQ